MLRTRTERYLTNADDIAANRSGTLTDKQRREAGALKLGTGVIGVVVLLVVGGLLAFPFVLLWQEQGELWGLVIVAVILLLVGVPVGLLVLKQLVRLVLTRQDLAAGDVQQADGVVTWRRRRYAAEFPGRAFWTTNSVTSLPPGPYRFYYLPRSGYVLSAEKLSGMMTLGGETADLNQVLGSVIGFGTGDLEANRDGRLGSGQGARMVAAMIGQGLIALLILGFCGFMAFSVLSDSGSDTPITLLFVGVIGLIGPLVIGWSIVKLGLDLLGGRVETVEGPVQRTYRRSGRSTTYYYQVNTMKFTVTFNAYQALVSGPVYRVYYAPRSKRLVALENVRS